MSDAARRQLARVAHPADVESLARALAARVRSEPAPDRGPGSCVHCLGSSGTARVGAPGQFGEYDLATCPVCSGTGRAPWPWEDRLALAAYAGDPAARSVADWTAGGNGRVYYRNEVGATVGRPDVTHPGLDLADWLLSLSRWPGALLRAAVAAGEVGFEGWLATDARHNGAPECDKASAHRCGECGGCNVIDVVRGAIEAARAHVDHPGPDGVSLVVWHRAFIAATDAAGEGLEFWPSWRSSSENQRARIRAAVRLAGEAPVREAICRELIGWALGLCGTANGRADEHA